MVQEKKSKRLSRKLQKSYVIKTDIDELSDVLCELLKLLNIEELHIMTYKDRIDVFATKEMTHYMWNCMKDFLVYILMMLKRKNF